jgi:hypothetical protein
MTGLQGGVFLMFLMFLIFQDSQYRDKAMMFILKSLFLQATIVGFDSCI